MSNISQKILFLSGFIIVMAAWVSMARPSTKSYDQYRVNDTIPEEDTADEQYKKSRKPIYQEKDRYGDPINNYRPKSPLLLGDPSNLEINVEPDDSLDNFIIEEKIGDYDYRAPSEMTFEEYRRYRNRQMLQEYWREKSNGGLEGGKNASEPKLPTIGFKNNFVDVRPNGMVTLDFGGKWQRVDNPAIPIRQQRNGNFDFDQQISMNVVGIIGERLKITANWDTKSTFEFQNNVKLEYNGKEEDIIQKIEAGTVSMPVNSTLISGAQNLFGIKTKMQFGRLSVTSVLSSQRGKSEEITLQGGSQTRNFEVRADNYEEYKHFFLSHFFRDRYEESLKSIPVVNSGVNVTRVEVYITNRTNNTQGLRNVVALLDMGENTTHTYNPSNVNAAQLVNYPADTNANLVYDRVKNFLPSAGASSSLEGIGLVKGTDFEIINSARKLTEREFTFNPQLGYISLVSPLRPDEVIAVAYQYSYNGKSYTVGETTDRYQNKPDDQVIYLKMLKPVTIKTRLPTWDLMMKNIYQLGATQISRENFQLRMIYKDDLSGADLPNLQEGQNTANVPLIRLFGLDRLNPNNDPPGDGNFDYVEGITIDSRYGRIMFPVLEPFGSALESKFLPSEADFVSKYVFSELYDSTKSDAQQIASKNKYYLKGRYQSSSSSDIMLPGINIAPGSVTVTAGSSRLVEGQDYTIDYNLGRLKIINEGVLSSNQEIKIRFEKQDLFNLRRKSFYGTRLDFQVNKDFIIGGTLLHQTEAPTITRTTIGDEPSSNTIWGLDMSVKKESRLLTKAIDKLPLIQTKAPSSVNFSGEFAQLLPGHSSIIDQNGGKDQNGVAFIDDFEGAKTPYDLTRSPTKWRIASTPRRFAESTSSGLDFSYRRALLAWYNIDNVFYRQSGNTVPVIPDPEIKNHFERSVAPQEVFPNLNQQVVNLNQVTLDLAYYPSERGMYNYNPGTDANGNLPGPASQNWSGMMREIRNDIDFDNANIQYIEFWMLSPYINSPGGNTTIDGQPFNLSNKGKLYFNLGSVSEDVIKDTRHGFENGIPFSGDQSAAATTTWGKVSTQQFLTNAFDNTDGAREKQDIGLDGLTNDEERAFFNSFLSSVPNASSDPSADDFKYFLGQDLDDQTATILKRYKKYNGMEGNSPVSTGGNNFTPSSTTLPDNEDLNSNNTLDDLEEYYEYEVDIDPSKLSVGSNFIVGRRDQNINGDNVTWLQFRIPIRTPNTTVGNINGFKSIRFMRMYMTGFDSPVVLRFAQLQLVANQWRVYQPDDINEKGFGGVGEPDDALMDVSTVNIEENGQGDANTSPYVLPPGFIRDPDATSTIQRNLNEQSLRLCVNDLDDGNARAVYKNLDYNLINYGKVNMFIHAETNDMVLNDGEVTAFIRLGTDFTQNYYEIEVPLYFTNPKNTTDPNAVWRSENEIAMPITALTDVKLARNRQIGFNFSAPFEQLYDGKNIIVVGNPDLTAVTTIMLGLRNPKDDNIPHSFCIWANELRVTDFNEKAGWATTATMNTKLADFASINSSIRYVTAGFGSLEQKVSQRERNNTLEYGAAGNFTMDKFIPQKLGLKLPMYLSYNRKLIMPQYDPLNPDIILKESLNNIQDNKERDKYKSLVIDETTSRAINFTNIQKVKTKPDAKNHFYDVENLTLSLGYSETKRTNFNIHNYEYKYYKGGIGYTYNTKGKSIEPFKNSKVLKSPYLKLVKDFNFNYMPSNFTFRTDVDRKLTKTQYYESGPLSAVQDPFYEKSFTFNRTYGTLWNITKSVTLDYKSNANAVVDEPSRAPGDAAYKDSVWSNFKNLGRLKNFDQQVGANYKVPLDKIPLTDWLNADLRYSGGYIWTSGALGIRDTLGNLIQNTSEKSINGRVNFEKLYNKVKFLKEINTPPAPQRGGGDREKEKQKNHQPDKKDTTQQTPKKDMKVMKAALRTVMLMKSVNFTYSLNEGTQLPGYMQISRFAGLTNLSDFNDFMPFVLGSQNPNIRQTAAENGWVTKSRSLNTPFTQMKNITMSARTTIEPIRDVRINLDAKKTMGTNYQEFFRVSPTDSTLYVSENPSQGGNYSISYISVKTAFQSDAAFQKFKENRSIVRSQLGQQGGGPYGLNSQDVLIPSFLSAYSGTSVNLNRHKTFPVIPLPNWKVDYTGLTKIKKVAKRFQSVSLSHGYVSQYTVSSFTSSLSYSARHIKPGGNINNTLAPDSIGANGNVIPVYIVDQVSIRESFAPLIGVNLRTKGKMTYKVEYKRSRNLLLSMSNAQITEDVSKDFVFGIGFAKSNVRIPKVFTKGQEKFLKNELNVRVDFTIRDSKTTQRKIDEGSTVTAGNLNLQFKPTVSYNITQRLTTQFYFERTINDPRISSSFRRTTTSFGVQLRFTLS